MAKIDVVIPVYNGEAFLDSLIATLENQTFKDFRAVFVDDGSKDNSYAVLKEKLEALSFESKVIHQENTGLPGARNTGIRAAEADWIVFLDSDDELDAHYLEFLYRGVSENSAKVGACRHQIVYSAADVRAIGSEEYQVHKVTSQECMKEYYRKWFGGAWSLILNREWMQENDLMFDDKCTFLEDIPFITQVIAYTDMIAFIENPLYLYYQRQGSLIHSPQTGKYKIAVEGYERMISSLKGCSGEAVDYVLSVGKARHRIALLRKAATLMEYDQFRELCRVVDLKGVREQIRNLPKIHLIVATVFMVSPWAFFKMVRLISK